MSWMEVSQVIKSLVISSTSKLYYIRDLERDFLKNEGYPILAPSFGYRNLEHMLQNMDDIKVVGYGYDAYLVPKNLAKSKHIQNYTKYGGKPKSRKPGNNNRMNQRDFQPRSQIPNSRNFQVFEKDFKEKLRMADIDDETPSTSSNLSSANSSLLMLKAMKMRTKAKTSSTQSARGDPRVMPACQPMIKPVRNEVPWCGDIEQKMLEEAKSEPQQRPGAANEKTKYVTTVNFQIPQPKKLDKNTDTIKILDGRSLHRFWFNRAEFTDGIARVMKTMTKFYSSEESQGLFLNQNIAVPGLYCAAEYNNIWHRAKILKILPGNKCKIIYIDFGTIAVLQIKELKYLALKFTKHPITAIRGLIANVRMLNGEENWHLEAIKSLGNIMFTEITARIHKFDSIDKVYYLTLTVPKEGSEEDFGEYLIKNDWAARNMSLQSPVISPGELSFEIYENGVDLDSSDDENEDSSFENVEVPSIDFDIIDFSDKVKDDANGNPEVVVANSEFISATDISDSWDTDQIIKNFNLLRSIHNHGKYYLNLDKLPDDMRRFNTGRYFPYKDQLAECDYMWYVHQKFHLIKIQAMTSMTTFKFYFLADCCFMVKCLRTLNAFYENNRNYKLPMNNAEVNRIVVVKNDGSFVRACIEKKLSEDEYQLYLLDFGKRVIKKQADFYIIYPDFLKWPPFIHNGKFAEIEPCERGWNAGTLKSLFNSFDEHLMQVQVHNYFLLNQEFSLYMFDHENLFINKHLCQRGLATYKYGI